MESDISGRNKKMWITVILAVLLFMSIGYNVYQKRKTYRLIDRLLDCVLSREMIVASDLKEGEYSALVSKIKQIQEVLGKHASSAEQEKEQVKSLVSNMSHQLKTPLANISLYVQILSKEEITPEQKTVFSEKMQRQVDKLSWMVESLSKMVKLEQNIDDFEGKAIEMCIRDRVIIDRFGNPDETDITLDRGGIAGKLADSVHGVISTNIEEAANVSVRKFLKQLRINSICKIFWQLIAAGTQVCSRCCADSL